MSAAASTLGQAEPPPDPHAPIPSAMHVPYQRSLLAPDRPLILILGASRGIGMCMTQDLIKLGGHVMIVSRDFLAMQELREKYPNQVDFVFTDLALPAAPRLVIEATIHRWGKIDGLVINHSVLSPMTRVENGDIEDWMHVFNTNFFSAAMICKHAIPHLRKVKGRIIFVSSHATQDTYSAWGPYSASKAALEQLSKTIAAEEPRIKCVSISPGPVKTMMYDEIRSHQGDQMDPEARETLNEKLQTGQFLTPAQVGGVIMRLSIWATQEMSGQHFRWGDERIKRFGTKWDQYRVYRVIPEWDNWQRNDLGHSLRPVHFWDSRNT